MKLVDLKLAKYNATQLPQRLRPRSRRGGAGGRLTRWERVYS